MQGNDWLIGILLRGGKLMSESGEVLLTSNPEDATEPPESSPLPVPEQDVGRLALVKGKLVGDVLYSAEVVEIQSRLAGALVQELSAKGMVSISDMQERIKEALGEGKVNKLCALVIGHKKSAPGATNETEGLTEFDFNDDLGRRIEQKVREVEVQRGE